jgi:phospholipid transport system substrate-binding protein
MISISGSRKSKAVAVRRPLMIVYLITLMAAVVLPHQANAGAPLDALQIRMKSLLDVLRDPSFRALPTQEEKKEKILPVIDEIFDYQELSKRTLSRNWKKLNAEQRQEFTDLFSKLLAVVYIDRLLEYTDEKVIFGNEKMLSKNKAEVQSKIVTSSKEIPIHYRMILKDDTWRVYDVLIEGVSLIRTYRSQFKKIFAKQGPEGLLEMLREKVAK